LITARSAVGAPAAAVQHEFEHVAIPPASGPPPYECLNDEPDAHYGKEPARGFQYFKQSADQFVN
jgi:hypothetical protein